jgi:hypothetical protein
MSEVAAGESLETDPRPELQEPYDPWELKFKKHFKPAKIEPSRPAPGKDHA